jgi:hypothetical protein
MGDYANMHASDMYHQELDLYSNIDESHKNNPKDAVPLNYIPYIDIKKRTDKAVLVKLAIQVSPFNSEKYDVDYMWLPIKLIRLDEDSKQVAIVQWLLERKIDEQCSIIAERLSIS